MSERKILLIAAVAFGLLLVLTLGLAPVHIQQDVSQRVAAALAHNGISWVTAEVRGRDVILRGEAPAERAISRALEIVGRVRGVRASHSLLDVASGKVDLGPGPSAAPAKPSPTTGYTARERAAAVAGLDVPSCQRLIDALLARESVAFEAASAAVRAQSIPLLEHLATAAVHCPDSPIVVEVVPDGTEDVWMDRVLSRVRARIVAEFLVSRGVRENRIGMLASNAVPPASDVALGAGWAPAGPLRIMVSKRGR